MTRLKTRVLGWSLVVIVLPTALTGCHAQVRDRSADPPLTFPDEGAVWCLPADRYPHVALGVPLRVSNTGSITIRSVRPNDPRGLRFVDAYVMPVRPTLRLGADPFPPTDNFPTGWRKAVPAGNAVVEQGQMRDLVAHLEYVGPGTAHLSSVTITYTVGDDEFVADTHIALRLASQQC